MLDILKVTISPEMLSLIGEIEEFKGAWQLLGRLAPERLEALHKIATIESIGSSTRIEGSNLSDLEVDRLLSNLKTTSFETRDEQEVVGYARVCEEVFQSYDTMVFSEGLIKQLHGWLLKYSDKDQRHRGEYKKFPNQVEAFDATGKSIGVIFQTTSPFDTPFRMQELIAWVQEALNNKILHPLLVIGIFVVIFLAIHPFQDGNGRLSRILTTLLLLQAGYKYVPYSSLESVIERNKEFYYLALRRTQATLKTDSPDFGPWLTFFLRSLQKQKAHLESKVARERALTVHISEIASQILELLQKHGTLSMANLEEFSGINRSTLKKHILVLIKQGNIMRLGQGKATLYSLR